MMKKIVALSVTLNMLISPAISLAAPTIPGFYGKVTLPSVAANALPTGGSVVSGTASILKTSDNLLNITQTTDKVVIEWKGTNGTGTDSFNIGSNATVRFYQGTGTPGTSNWTPNSSYVALNRIYQSSPTQIYGKLVADGKVYLINQNGILFGPGSQVNVHTLIASTFNISNNDFLNGLLRFTGEDYQHYDPTVPVDADNQQTLAGADPNAAVVNRGIDNHHHRRLGLSAGTPGREQRQHHRAYRDHRARRGYP